MKVKTHTALCDRTRHKSVQQNNKIVSDFYTLLAFLNLQKCFRGNINQIQRYFLYICRKGFFHLFLNKYFPCYILSVMAI